MASALVADTHATIWYLFADPRLSATAHREMDNAAQAGLPIYVPAITLVEITYLVEKGRIAEELFHGLIEALENPEDALTLAPLNLAVSLALPNIPRDEIPDMPDRIIAATALTLGLPLITRDGKIQTSRVTTLW